jgi:hypothetical protein
MINQREFVRIIANDEKEYFLEKHIAYQCLYFEEKLRRLDKSNLDFPTLRVNEIRGEILEISIQYLHYKSKYCKEISSKVPSFPIKPELALDVLNASILLKI